MIEHKRIIAVLLVGMTIVMVVVVIFVARQEWSVSDPPRSDQVFIPTVVSTDVRILSEDEKKAFLESDDPVDKALRAYLDSAPE